MTLSYPGKTFQSQLPAIIDGYRDWFHLVMKCLLYPEKDDQIIPAPPGIPGGDNDTGEKSHTLQSLAGIHNEAVRAAVILMESARGGAKPPYSAFDSFLDLFDELFVQLRRMEQELIQTDLGVDPVSGLRSRKAMEGDLAREMERRSRRGKPFCLVLAHIDDYEKWSAGISDSKRQLVARHIASLISKCVRSFDDAYRIGDGEFIMALKQSETAGGLAAIKRLRSFLSQYPVAIDGVPPITMSFCTAEPTPGDDLGELITNMKRDLTHHDDEKGSASMEYLEQSPLERFIKTMEAES